MKYNIYNQIKNEKSLSGKLNVVRYDKNLRKIILQIIFSIFLLYFLYYLVTRSFNLDLGLKKTFEWYLKNRKYYLKINKKDIVKRLGILK